MLKSRLDEISEQSTTFHHAYKESMSLAYLTQKKQTEVWDKITTSTVFNQVSTLSLFSYIIHKKQRRLHDGYTNLLPIIQQAREASLHTFLEARAHLADHEIAYYHAAVLEAHKAGISIQSSEPDTIQRALWYRDHIPAGKSNLFPLEAFDVTTLTAEELEQNLQGYHEMQLSFDETELNGAQDFLFHIPLTHMTRSLKQVYSPEQQALLSPLRSHRALSQAGRIRSPYSFNEEKVSGFTYELDKVLGLDQYVYMCMGTSYSDEASHTETTNVLLFDPHLLLDTACIVTPDDISNLAPYQFHHEVVESDAHLADIASYRSKIVTGTGWVDILRRRIALYHRTNPNAPIPLTALFTLGEIKYKDQVPISAFRGILSTNEEMKQYIRDMSPYITFPSFATPYRDSSETKASH